ncbi:class I SAM-dependent methyltransferase [Granulicella arctica]|uniref:class I SAM-dependent methyltransferase n=1 Tax=Granulicella arctica TaxID=940613 RepID=UPI0021E080BF|nr:class I SAM-dependent methyltransferase [Granulicella arctica]
MQAAIPSRTALRVALRRAAHQRYDAKPLVLDDPIAIPILGPEYLSELHKSATKLNKPFSLGMRAHLVARSRYAEDQLARAVVENNVQQYVLLGAGLDTFAHRSPHPNLHVFEVDHPATQQWKRDLLATTTLPHPAALTYVPVDFEVDTLPQQLQIAGHNPALPTVFAMLGVVPYLTREAFRATIAFIAAQPANSGLIFDYSQPRSALPFLEQLAHDSLAARVILAGEPFQLFFTPREAAAELAAFYDLEDLGAPEINALYFDTRPDKLRLVGTAGRLLSAWL